MMHKIRKIGASSTGSAFGITIPKHIAEQNFGVKFYPLQVEGNILLISGCENFKITKLDIVF